MAINNIRIRCGTDIVSVGRIGNALKSGARFAEKVFTDIEIAYCEARKAGRYESYAARFAAKEAFFKALGVGMFGGAALTDVGIENDGETGEPRLKLRGGAEALYRQKGGVDLSVSLSHTADTAIATIVILCEDIESSDNAI